MLYSVELLFIDSISHSQKRSQKKNTVNVSRVKNRAKFKTRMIAGTYAEMTRLGDYSGQGHKIIIISIV